MILVDALYINNGGGKILLDYLIAELEKSTLDVYFLLDNRIKGKHYKISEEKVIYLKGNFFKRHYFYLTNKKRFSKVLCFGNLPPNIKINAEVLTYFHQPMYLDIPDEFSFIEKFKFKCKIAILKQIAENTDYWLIQSPFIKEKLISKFHFKSEKVKVLPFYPEFISLDLNIIREENTYLYVSNATPHKNHKRLITVFCDFFDKYKKGKLILTVNEDYPEILGQIKESLEKGYPIENIGFVDRATLQKKYRSSEFLIFPSLTESFGLGLIEAIDCGCKVIGADLPYTYEVCEPSLLFDPLSNISLFKALENSLNSQKVKPSVPKIKNEISELISLLQN
jgi:glycosyltransferase involved in cell wall biosynthesis